MKTLINRLIFCLKYTTRLPLGKDRPLMREDYRHMTPFLPLCGLLVGLLSCGAMYAGSLAASMLVPAAFTALGAAFFTGGQPLADLAHMSDAFLPWRRREDVLEQLSAPRLTWRGVLAIVLAIVLRVSAVYILIVNLSMMDAARMVVLAAVFGRMVLASGAAASVAVEAGPAGKLIDGVSLGGLFLAQLLFFPLFDIVLTDVIVALYAMAAAVLLGTVGAKLVSAKLRGITEETLGMLSEVGEVLFLWASAFLYVLYESVIK